MQEVPAAAEFFPLLPGQDPSVLSESALEGCLHQSLRTGRPVLFTAGDDKSVSRVYFDPEMPFAFGLRGHFSPRLLPEGECRKSYSLGHRASLLHARFFSAVMSPEFSPHLLVKLYLKYVESGAEAIERAAGHHGFSLKPSCIPDRDLDLNLLVWQDRRGGILRDLKMENEAGDWTREMGYLKGRWEAFEDISRGLRNWSGEDPEVLRGMVGRCIEAAAGRRDVLRRLAVDGRVGHTKAWALGKLDALDEQDGFLKILAVVHLRRTSLFFPITVSSEACN